MAVAATVYAAQTWDAPHRPALLTLMGLTAGGAIPMMHRSVRRIVDSRWCEVFFLTWSTIVCLGITAGAALDGGTDSPFVYMYFVSLVFVSLSYPLWSLITIGVMELMAYVGLAAASGASVADTYATMAALAGTVTMCAWHARVHARQRSELARLSRIDPLTGCLNRRGFEDRLVAALGHAERSGDPLSVLIFDLDAFKEVNDRVGHAGGDQVLRRVVAAALATLRPADALGRLGGDEFAIVAVGANAHGADVLARRLRATLSVHAGASVGAATYGPDGSDSASLLARADAQLYAAKRTGRPADRLGAPGRKVGQAASAASLFR